MTGLVWGRTASPTCLRDFLDELRGREYEAIAAFEAAAGIKGDWDYDPDHGHDWWGVGGTFNGVPFTVYTHKSGTLKIGAALDFVNGGFTPLDVAGLKAALLAIADGVGA